MGAPIVAMGMTLKDAGYSIPASYIYYFLGAVFIVLILSLPKIIRRLFK
jgi:hypothetical protein